mmetsp:Transcript_13345/g.42839  ORF Transcript_13345/g.42839 Transcript_13345/m.42839 type:complete len:113 (+) Transcript_13345:136-474(+)
MQLPRSSDEPSLWAARLRLIQLLFSREAADAEKALPLDSILAQCVEALRSAAPGVRRAAAELLVHLHATSDAQALRQVEVGLAQQPPVPAAIEADVQAAFLQALSEHSKLAS